MIEGVGRLVAPTARACSVRVDVAAAAAGVHVRADEAELQDVLVNLLLNAIQACRPGGRVAIAVEPGDPVRIRVTDDGCGIPAEHRKRIFEPFFSMRQGGTGLGLFLSLNFVRRWGGDIRFDSTPGNRFNLRGRVAFLGSRRRGGSGAMSGKVSVLLVDDDAAFRRIMAGELGRLGYEVTAAGSGEEAVLRAGQSEPDVVLLDLQLPTMNGLDVLKTLRQRGRGAEIIMLTGHGSIDTAIESIRMGAFDYVVKPCPLDELEIRIQRRSNGSRSGRGRTSWNAASPRRTWATPLSAKAPSSVVCCI